MKAKPLPPQDYLHECFEYLPSGILLWKERPHTHFNSFQTWRMWNARFAGDQSGTVEQKYLRVLLNKVPYLVHRIIFKMHHNEEPEEIDHINRIRSDNRIDNLRAANAYLNQNNKSNNLSKRSGHSGITWDKSKDKWKAQTRLQGKQLYVGLFNSIPEALEAQQQFLKDYQHNASSNGQLS